MLKKLLHRFKSTQPSRPELRQIAAASLRDRWSSYPSNGLTPATLAAILREADQGVLWRQAELFEEMEEKDAHLSAVLQNRKLAVTGLNWEVQAYAEDAIDREIAGFCDETLRSIRNFEDALLDLLDAVGKGYAVCEISWVLRDGHAVPEQLAWIHPKRISLWDSLVPRILTDADMVRGIEPPPWKMVVHRYKARSGHDTRAGVLRVCAWMYLFKNYAIKDWAVFAEVFGMPLRLGKYEPSASQADRDALVTALQSLGTDAAGIISKSTEIEFVEASQRQSGSANPYDMLVQFCNREISKAVLGQTLTTDTTGATGTYAAGKVHDGVRRDILEADSKALADTIRMQLLQPLVGFNYGWDRKVPYFNFNLEQEEDLKAVAETYEIVQRLGFPLTLEHVADRFGIALPDEGQTVIQGQGKREEGQGQKAGEEPEERAEQEEQEEAFVSARAILPLRDGGTIKITEYDRKVIREQLALEQLTQAAVQASAAVVDRMLAPVRERIEAGQSLEELRDGLLDAYPEMPVEELGELLYQASMLAYMKGRDRAD